MSAEAGKSRRKLTVGAGASLTAADEEEMETLGSSLLALGLSRSGVLGSTGVERHLERVRIGEIDAATLAVYVQDLGALCRPADAPSPTLSADFWDVRTPLMAAAGHDEYSLASALSRPKYAAYRLLLSRSLGHLCEVKESSGCSSVAAALAILCEVAAYTAAGQPLDMAALVLHPTPEKQAIFLWQQLVTGTNREIPYLGREAYTHGFWARFNVVEMWRYHTGRSESVDEVWGLHGFSDRCIRDATNTNQIEHMAISAVAQAVLGLPVLALNLVEELEWMLRRGSYAASQADKCVNSAVGACLVPRFSVADPAEACAALEVELGR